MNTEDTWAGIRWVDVTKAEMVHYEGIRDS